MYGLFSTSPLELFILLNPASGAEVFLIVLFLFLTVNFTYLISFLVINFMFAASIVATFAPVSIFAITLLIFKSGRATFSFQPTALSLSFFLPYFYKIT